MITEAASQTAQPKVQCRMIRSKWMFIEAEPDPTVPHTESNICWCVHTQKCIGPDGQVVTPDACNSERDCFEAL
jgi:hypothetical protein